MIVLAESNFVLELALRKKEPRANRLITSFSNACQYIENELNRKTA